MQKGDEKKKVKTREGSDSPSRSRALLLLEGRKERGFPSPVAAAAGGGSLIFNVTRTF